MRENRRSSSIHTGRRAGRGHDSLIHLGTRLAYFGPDLKEESSFSLKHGREVPTGFLGDTPPKAAVDWIKYLNSTRKSPEVYAIDNLSISILGIARIPQAPMPLAIARSLRKAHFSPLGISVLLGLADSDLGHVVSSPEEQVAVLSRECDRLERLLRREEENAGYLSLSSIEGTPIGKYVKGIPRARDVMKGLLGEAEAALKTHARRLLPSTTAVLGERTVARLLAASGSLRQFSSLSASRIQLLGSKRRSVGRTPRYGYLYLAEGMDRVPPGRRGALARSLSSMAAIAIRADTLTHTDISASLSQRKERRIRELERAGGAAK